MEPLFCIDAFNKSVFSSEASVELPDINRWTHSGSDREAILP